MIAILSSCLIAQPSIPGSFLSEPHVAVSLNSCPRLEFPAFTVSNSNRLVGSFGFQRPSHSRTTKPRCLGSYSRLVQREAGMPIIRWREQLIDVRHGPIVKIRRGRPD